MQDVYYQTKRPVTGIKGIRCIIIDNHTQTRFAPLSKT